MPTDQDLLARIVEGDQAALTELYGRYYRRMARFLLRVTRDPQLAAEVINDVFLVIWQKGRDFRGDSSLSSWILGSVTHIFQTMTGLASTRWLAPREEAL